MANSVLFRVVALLLLVSCCSLLDKSISNGVDASQVSFPSKVVSVKFETNQSSFFKGEYRTGYHFRPPFNWISDPCGLMYYKGVYHFFYQYNPKGTSWGNIIWSHMVSSDLINWVSLKPAIYPSKWFDIKGTWSGSATILPDKGPVLMYTGIDPDESQVQIVAYPKNISDPFLEDWVKPDYNPVIVPDKGVNRTAIRDPSTAWLGPDKVWRLLVGSRGIGDQSGLAILYHSKDFVNWTRAKQPFHALGDDIGLWECPDLFPVALEGEEGLDTSAYGDGLKHVFKVSLDVSRYDYYIFGTYDPKANVFVPEPGAIDNGNGLRYDYGRYYASRTFFDQNEKRRILWGYTHELDTLVDDAAKGFSHVETIPRKIWLDPNGRQIRLWPVRELDTLRGKSVNVLDQKIKSGHTVEIGGIQTAQADVEVTFEVPSLDKAEPFDSNWTNPQELCNLRGADVQGGVGPFGLFVLASKDLEERTGVFFKIFMNDTKHVVLFCHDNNRSSLRREVKKPSYGAFIDYDIQKEKKIALRTLIDQYVVESFGAEGRAVITSIVYPILAEGSGINLFAFNNGLEKLTISNLTAWEMNNNTMTGLEMTNNTIAVPSIVNSKSRVLGLRHFEAV